MTDSGVAPPSLVLVTGATGYIGAHVVKRLLDEGYAVRASARNPTDESKIGYLRKVSSAPDAAERLTFVRLELTDETGWSEAVAGCVGVVHTAMHVFKPTSKTEKGDPHKLYVEPALKGLESLLRACRDSGTVRRIVMTSSVQAVSDSFPKWRTQVYTPDTWNEEATLKTNPYAFAKTLAEKRLHEFMKDPAQNTSGMTFAAVLPFAVFGPSLSKQPGDNDVAAVLRLLNGEFPVLPPLSFGVVDVRDVAAVHERALRVSDANGKRFIASAKPCQVGEFVRMLAEDYPQFKSRFPTLVVPRSVILFAGRFVFSQQLMHYFRSNLGVTPKLDTSNVRDVLGFEFRAPKETVHDSAKWFLDNGKVKGVKAGAGAGTLATKA